MFRKKLLSLSKCILSSTLILCLLVGCSSQSQKKSVIADKDGNLLRYSVQNDSETSSVPDGYYVMHGTFASPILNYGILEPSDKKIQWFTKKYENLIPECKNGDKIIYISSENSPSNSDLNLCKMNDKGYSLGAIFSTIKADDSSGKDTVTFPSDSNYYCSASPIKQVCTQITEKAQGTILINEINKKTFSTNLLNHGIFANAQKNGLYNIGYYIGTQYSTVDVIADTHIFKASKKTYHISSYQKTKIGYFTINLPDDMENGYYWLGSLGLFKYSGGEDSQSTYADDNSNEDTDSTQAS